MRCCYPTKYQFISGTRVRKIAELGEDVSRFVFPSVDLWLRRKMVAAAFDP